MKSNCCGGEMVTRRGDEGMCFYICIDCDQPCDLAMMEEVRGNDLGLDVPTANQEIIKKGNIEIGFYEDDTPYIKNEYETNK